MLTLYLVGLIAGGLLLVLSLLAFGDGDDGELESDADVHEAGEHALGDASDVALAMLVLPVGSLRFWTFFLAFGGLAGTLTTLAGAGVVGSALSAALAGYASGVGATGLVRWLGKTQVSSTIRRDACVGATGVVLLPVGRGTLGRVRVQLDEQMLDLDAVTDDERELAVGHPAVVYEMRDDGVVLVTGAREGA
ncbi:MAG: hypothetical protein KF795_09345 [Labilithrix sp.]|nr:hypothetical protein [Labilithrix sp.]